MIKHLSIKISGKVQGVFYRASAKEKADELNIRGFVRNEPDDTVYAEAEGEEANLKLFVEWCHQGPSRARVDHCTIVEGAVKGFTDFVIVR